MAEVARETINKETVKMTKLKFKRSGKRYKEGMMAEVINGKGKAKKKESF